jgi:hypothetical protein
MVKFVAKAAGSDICVKRKSKSHRYEEESLNKTEVAREDSGIVFVRYPYATTKPEKTRYLEPVDGYTI